MSKKSIAPVIPNPFSDPPSVLVPNIEPRQLISIEAKVKKKIPKQEKADDEEV